MKRQQLLGLLVEHLPPILVREYGQRDVCIPASYHVHHTLRWLGVPSRLAMRDVYAGNAAWWSWFRSGCDGDMPADGWSVGASHRNPNPGPGLDGHLVVVSKGAIVDCAIGQFSRPKKGMPVPNGILVRGNVWCNDEVIVAYAPNPLPVPPMWANAPAATSAVARQLRALIKDHETTNKQR